MKDRRDQEVVSALVKVLTQQNGSSAVPDLYHNGSLPVPQRPGLLTRWFDRTGAARDEYAHKQLLVILETELKALQIEAEGYIETVQLDAQSRVRVHEHRVLQHEAILKKRAEGEAQINLHVMQQRLIEQATQLGLDPVDEQYLIQKIIATCMTNPKDKENRNGHK